MILRQEEAFLPLQAMDLQNAKQPLCFADDLCTICLLPCIAAHHKKEERQTSTSRVPSSLLAPGRMSSLHCAVGHTTSSCHKYSSGSCAELALDSSLRTLADLQSHSFFNLSVCASAFRRSLVPAHDHHHRYKCKPLIKPQRGRKACSVH